MNELIKVAALAAVLSASAVFAQDPSTEPARRAARGRSTTRSSTRMVMEASARTRRRWIRRSQPSSATRQGQEWYAEHHRVERCKDK